MALCFEWAGYLVPRDMLPPFHNICCADQTVCPPNTPVQTVLLKDLIVRWTWGWGGGGRGIAHHQPLPFVLFVQTVDCIA